MSDSYVLGLIAGEGSFSYNTSLQRGSDVYIMPRFRLQLGEKDREQIYALQDQFSGAGSVYEQPNGLVWSIENKEDLRVLKDRLSQIDGGPVWEVSQKKQSFEVWCQLVEIYCDGRTTDQQRREMVELVHQYDNYSTASETRWDEVYDRLGMDRRA